MSNKIQLFQNGRIWPVIQDEVWSLVNVDHTEGRAQKSSTNELLESTLATLYSRKHCITTACCTDALTLSIIALNLPENSLIGVNNYTFTASAHAISRAGHRVLPLDVKQDYCLDIDNIPKCDAIVNVDLFGNMADWGRLTELGIPVINDAAQSLESNNSKYWSASCGLVSCVSFSPSKTISSWGSGGAILTDDDDIAARCRQLRLHGKTSNDSMSIHPGLNSMMSSFESACVMAGLSHATEWRTRRRDIAEYLISMSRFETSIDLSLEDHTLHKLVFKADDRDRVLKKFKKAGVDCVVHYQRLINDENLYHIESEFPVSDYLKEVSFTVPNQHTLTDDEVEQIGALLK